MSHTPCDRWIALSDRQALCEPLSAEELAFVEQHAADCEACGREAACYRYLAERFVTDPESRDDATDLEARAVRSDPPDRAPAPEEAKRGDSADDATREQAIVLPLRSWRRPLGAAALVAAAAVVVAVWYRGTEEQGPAGAVGAVRPVLATGTSIQNVLPLLDAEGQIADGALVAVTEGRVCVRYDAAIYGCLGPQSAARFYAAAPRQRRAELERGTLVVSLQPQPATEPFSVITQAGTITALGTVFSVRASSDGEQVSTAVLEGHTRVAPLEGEPRVLEAGQQVQVGADAVEPYEHEASDRALLKGAMLFQGGPSAFLEVTTSVAGCGVAIDGTRLGPPPFWVRLSPGHKQLVVSGPCEDASREPVDLVAKTTVRRALTSPLAPGASVTATASDAPPSPSAAQLLAQARDDRAAQRYRQAATAYRELIATYPRSPEAQVALVSLGDILLHQLGDAAEALAAFRAYGTGGALGQEATLGQIHALRALGRTAEEIAVIEQFLAAYPNSVHREVLAQRLAELRPVAPSGDGPAKP